jgi:MFS transporter, DHA2 family, methylenomycin A resistance protein
MPPDPSSKAVKTSDRRGLVLFTLSLGVLVAQIDTSVANLAAKQIGSAFQASVTALQWVLDAYNLTYAVLLLSGGLCADLFGRRRIFQAGTAIIAISSVVCVAAPSIGVLIAARAVMGLGSAMLLPASLAIVRVVWPDEAARRRALGVWASCNGLAFVIGPTVGGLLIGRFGWQSVFLIAVPLAITAFALARPVVPESADPAGRSLDIKGQILGATAMGGLVFAVIAFRDGGAAWLVSLFVSLLATPLFLFVEQRAAGAALLPLALFRSASFCGAVTATSTMTFGIYGMIFLVPLVWQSSGLLTPQQAGLGLMPCAILFVLIAPRSGHLAQWIGVRASTAGGTAIIGLGLLVLSLTRLGQPLLLAGLGLGLTGVGMGINTGPLMAVAVGAVGPERAGTAASVINVARMVGATLGVAVLGATFALLGGGTPGFSAAMLLGGLIQLCGALTAWATVCDHTSTVTPPPGALPPTDRSPPAPRPRTTRCTRHCAPGPDRSSTGAIPGTPGSADERSEP